MSKTRAVVVTTSVDLASSAKDVWPLITDTDRMNRIIGGHPVVYRPIEKGGGEGGPSPARFVAETTAGGFKLEYEEFPFEWSHGRSFSVYRKMRGGILASYAMSLSLQPLRDSDLRQSARGIDQGTRATFRLQLEPSSWIVRPIVQLTARRFVASCASLAEAIDAHVRDRAPSPYLKPVSPPNQEHLAFALSELKKLGVSTTIADKMSTFLREAPDSDLVRIRPYEVAEQWSEDRREVLRTFLRAVPAGLVEMRWALICPSCRTASEQHESLEEISAQGHCQLCDISFELDLDRAVEASFVVHPSVRTVPDQMFCMGGPARTPHVLVQSNILAGEVKSIDGPEDNGRYRIFARGGASASLEVVADGPDQVEVVVGTDRVSPADVRVKRAGILRVKNASLEPRHVKIERLAYASLAATAHEVSTLGDFRTLFSRDLLKRGTPLKVARVAVLFTDLTGSTALYSSVGDAAAFRLVDDHFDMMRAIIDERHGVIVKTMGDAVMAAFSDSSQGVRAGVEALMHFEKFRATTEHGKLVGLKLGIYSGPCYVVTANGALDYFGQTVNVASRIQHLAASGEFILEEQQLEELSDDIRNLVAAGERFEATVKGVLAPLKLVRVRLSSGGVRESRALSGPSIQIRVPSGSR